MLPYLLTISTDNERDFLEALYNDYGDRMYRAAYKLLENRQDAEDAVQDTFIKICENIDRFLPLSGEELTLLIIVCVRNTARDLLRKRAVALRHTVDEPTDRDGDIIPHSIPDPDGDVLDKVVHDETVRQTAALIDSLPEAQRDVIILKYRYDMREKEIASLLGISETAVSSRVLRAKERIKKGFMQ